MFSNLVGKQIVNLSKVTRIYVTKFNCKAVYARRTICYHSSSKSRSFTFHAPLNNNFSSTATIHSSLEEDKHKSSQNIGATPLKKYLESPLKGVTLNSENDVLTLEFGNDTFLDYPVTWLKDNCRCTKCYDPFAQSRIIDLQSFRVDSVPTSTQVEGEHLLIAWDDGHVSKFSKEWLCKNSFEKHHQYERMSQRHVQPSLWRAKNFLETPACRTFSFMDIIEDDFTLLKWLESLSQYGVAHISGTPPASGQTLRLAERVGFAKQTHYGTEFIVMGKEGAENVAYKTGALQLHTDLPYYHYTPGVILLHCIIQSSSGGENILTDGFNAVRELSPRHYRILADTVIDWIDLGQHKDEKFKTINRAPVLCENSFGELERINWSQPQRDSMFNVTIPRAIEWYSAMKELCRILHDSENAVTLKTQPGDILSFDNRRVLHGRMNYTDSRRLLSGIYLDWDEIYSKLRVLRDQLSENS